MRAFAIALLLVCAAALRADLAAVTLKTDSPPTKAVAVGPANASIDGRIDGPVVTFDSLPKGVAWDVQVTLKDGTVLAGVDMGWYAPLANDHDPSPEPLDDDAKAEIGAIVGQIPSFYNKSDLLLLRGDAKRAVGLVQLVRDSAFHASKDGEIIWRVELYYFEYQAGGWAKVQQQNKVLRRERFKTRAEYEAATAKLKWTPELGGLKNGAKVEVK
jgi:hypothetical protein